MNTLIAICAVTTGIAALAAISIDYVPLQRRLLPWSAGILLGIALFWILPEIAQDRGWPLTLSGISIVLLLLGLIDRYVYPLCPFCVAGVHSHVEGHTAGARHHAVTLGWPLLLFGCLHTFFDGWTIALSHVSSSTAAAALSWGATVHKIPESVAIGMLAARLTSSQRMALGVVALLQAVMAAGMVLAVLAGNLDSRWAELSGMPACAFLLLFGLLALQQEWRMHGRAWAIGAAAPGLAICGLGALLSTMLR